MPLDLIPIAICPIIPNQANPNLTPIIFGITNGGDFPTNVIYVPDNLITPPAQNIPGKQVITPYYYIYTYNQFIAAFNTAINASFVAAGSPGGIAPFFIYNAESTTIDLIVSATFIASGATVYYNQVASNYIDTIRALFRGYNQPNGKDFVFNTTPLPGNSNAYALPGTVLTNPGTYYIFKGEYSMLPYWSPMEKIIITTTGIPIQTENVPSFNFNGSQNSDTVSFPVLSDYTPFNENVRDLRGIAYYVPNAEYKLVDLNGNGPLNKLDLKVYWADKNGNLYPFEVSSRQAIDIKIGFFKKELYKNR
jgi:hypothetical protein